MKVKWKDISESRLKIETQINIYVNGPMSLMWEEKYCQTVTTRALNAHLQTQTRPSKTE